MPLEPPTVALELFEYKMDDLRNRRPVRGGIESLWELRRDLSELRNRLDPAQLERFDLLTRELGQRETIDPGRDRAQTDFDFDDLVIGDDDRSPRGATTPLGRGGGVDLASEIVFDDPEDDVALASEVRPPTPEERAELDTLQRLAQRVFGREVDRFAEGVAAGWRAERERTTARLLYAAMRNLDRFREKEAFEHDINLRQFKVVEPLPELSDPLVSLTDADSLVVIARDVIDAILTLRQRRPAPPIDRSGALDYVRRVALAVARDPYAGAKAPSSQAGPTAAELRSAIADLARQRLPDWQRRSRRDDLEERLRERQELERSQVAMLRRDQARFTSHVEAFFARLEQVLPRSMGGNAEEPQLVGGVLFAVSPGLRRTELAQEASELTLRMVGAVRLPFAGRNLVITVHAGERHLYVGRTEIALDDDRITKVEDDEVETFVEGDYLHVRVRESGGSLAARVAVASAVVHVLAGEHRQERMATLRMLSPGAAGSASDVVVEALRRAAQIVSKAPDTREALEKLILGAARAIGVELERSWVDGFVERARLAVAAGPAQLDHALALLASSSSEPQHPQLVPFIGEPVDVNVGGRTVTVRRYGIRGADHLVAMLPGQVIGSFREILVERFGTGAFVCVYGEQQIVLAFLPDVAIPHQNDM